ncbi:MAG: hypothetical protein AAF845_13775 [Bacteroidota bacterium]
MRLLLVVGLVCLCAPSAQAQLAVSYDTGTGYLAFDKGAHRAITVFIPAQAVGATVSSAVGVRLAYTEFTFEEGDRAGEVVRRPGLYVGIDGSSLGPDESGLGFSSSFDFGYDLYNLEAPFLLGFTQPSMSLALGGHVQAGPVGASARGLVTLAAWTDGLVLGGRFAAVVRL